jgi:hypothetical protein
LSILAQVHFFRRLPGSALLLAAQDSTSASCLKLQNAGIEITKYIRREKRRPSIRRFGENYAFSADAPPLSDC